MTDTADIDSIIGALYETISGPAGVDREWGRMQDLFHPRAHQVRTGVSDDGIPWVLVMDTEDYRANVAPFLQENDFYEMEVARRTERFGNIAHVFSTYEARHDPDDPEPIKRGINSIQLYNDSARWWVMNMIWDNERADNPLPDEYLK